MQEMSIAMKVCLLYYDQWRGALDSTFCYKVCLRFTKCLCLLCGTWISYTNKYGPKYLLKVTLFNTSK